MTVEAALHAAAAVLALAALVRLLAVRRTQAPIGFLAAAAGGTVVWSLSIVVYLVEDRGSTTHAALWLPSISFTTMAVLLWAMTFTTDRWRAGLRWTVPWLLVAVVSVGLRAGVGTPAVAPLYIFNTVYCFAVLLALAAVLSRRLHDPSPVVRSVVRGVMAAGIVVLVAESLRVRASDVVAATTVAALAWVLPRHGAATRVAPDPQTILDDLGALLFVFDRDRLLVDTNAPARLFFSLRGVDPPARGTPAPALVGVDLAGSDVLRVRWEQTDLTGYAQRLPSSGSPPDGWLVLLRRTTPGDTDQGTRHRRRDLMSRLPSYEPSTGLLTRRALDQTLAEAAAYPGAAEVEAAVAVLHLPEPAERARAAQALAERWEGQADTVVVGHLDAHHVALVVRRPDDELGTTLPGADVRVASSTLADAARVLGELRG